MDWTRDHPTWSDPELSRRINLAPHRWHVQETGNGPSVLLLPGSGSSVHTWRDILPILAPDFHVITLDLPGHGFTKSPGGARSGLDQMTADVLELVEREGWDLYAIVGHSAGAAIALRMVNNLQVERIVGINPALSNFEGVASWLFPMLAKVMAMSPFTASLFTIGATEKRAQTFIKGTGSKLDDAGYRYYARLMQDRDHVNGALNMMARWSLDALLSELSRIETRCLFITGDGDLAVPPDVGKQAAAKMPNAEHLEIVGLGHLAHEEDPARLGAEIRRFLVG